jgi:ketosteroid isomerase-like protein
MNIEQAHEFAASWVRAWNMHNLDGVLSHFADDAVFTSPVAVQLLPETNGVLKGKEAIRSYWTIGLERIPDLHFKIENVFNSVETVVINYRNHTGGLVNEVLHLNEAGLVDRGDGTYLVASAADVSGARSQ